MKTTSMAKLQTSLEEGRLAVVDMVEGVNANHCILSQPVIKNAMNI